MAVKLDNIFNSAMKNSLFKEKGVLQINHTPETIPHRDKEIEQIASILAPILRGERCSNIFLYGKTGTGKTLCVQYVCDEISKRAEKIGVGLRIEYLNCKLKKVADTEYRILAALIDKLGGNVAATGLPTDQVYSKFIELIDNKKQLVVLVLDEVDQAVLKMSDSFLYNLTRLNQELSKAQISLIGISNNVTFLDSVDPRVKSSLGEEEIVFFPYNAPQLQDIIKTRCSRAFKEGVIGEGVIAKCSALAAREHGDARRALDLIRIAGELSERDGSSKVDLKYLDMANERIEKDKILEIVETAPKQSQLVLYSILYLQKQAKKQDDGQFFTGDVYNVYQELCTKTKTEILTQRRVSDLIADLDMTGIINANVISKGRHGRTKEIKLAVSQNLFEKVEAILVEGLGL